MTIFPTSLRGIGRNPSINCPMMVRTCLHHTYLFHPVSVENGPPPSLLVTLEKGPSCN